MTTKAVANFLEVCELPSVIDVYSQRKKLVAMVREYQEHLKANGMAGPELTRILEVTPHETQTPNS